MVDADVKGDAPKQLGRIALKRRPVPRVAEPREPGSRLAQLVALSEMYGVPALDLEQVCLNLSHLIEVPKSLALHHVLIPVLSRSDRLFVAMRDPSQTDVIQEIEFVAGKRVYAYAAPPEDIARALEGAYRAKERGQTHYVGPECPVEALRRAGLDPDGKPLTEDASADEAPREPEGSEASLSEPGESESAPSPRMVSFLPPDDRAHRDSGPPATVSAFPPRRSSSPPGSNPASALAGEQVGDAVSAVEDAFDEMLEDTSTISCIPISEAELGKPSVLVVDDEPEVRRALERVLRAEGFSVRSTNSGLSALRLIKERAPDVLVLDAMLPEVHGFEIARRLRSSQRYRDLPIVMVSAVYRGWRFAEELRESCGVEHYFEKPFRPEDVKAAVTQLVSAIQADGAPSPLDLSRRAEQALQQGMRAYKCGEVAQAIQELERGVSIDPLAYRLHFNLGLLFAQEGRTYDAIRALERAVEINSGHFAGLKNLAIMYAEAGFRNRAVELWQRALELAPDERTGAAIQEHLAGLLSQEGLS